MKFSVSNLVKLPVIDLWKQPDAKGSLQTNDLPNSEMNYNSVNITHIELKLCVEVAERHLSKTLCENFVPNSPVWNLSWKCLKSTWFMGISFGSMHFLKSWPQKKRGDASIIFFSKLGGIWSQNVNKRKYLIAVKCRIYIKPQQMQSFVASVDVQPESL